MEITTFQTFGNQFRSSLALFSEKASSELISSIGPLIAVGLTIYVLLMAWSIADGRKRFSDVIFTVVKISFVSVFALNAGNFAAFVIPLVNQFQEILLSAASKGLGKSLPTPWAAIDGLWLQFTDCFELLSETISSLSWKKYLLVILFLFVAIVVMAIVSVFFTFSALGVLLINEVAMILVLAFGPLFICTLMFPALRSWFDGWLKSLVTFSFTLVLTATAASLFAQVFNSCLLKINDAATSTSISVTKIGLPLLNFCVLALIAATLIRQIPTITAALTGGVNFGAVGIGQMMHGIGQTGRAIGGGLALGAGTALGSKGLASAGSKMLGSQGLGTGGALAMAGLGASVGGVAKVAGSLVQEETQKFNQFFRSSRADTATPQKGSVADVFSRQEATAQKNAEIAKAMAAKKKKENPNA